MNLNSTVNDLINYAESNPLIAAAAAVVLLYLLFKKPKVLLVITLILLFLGAIMKVIARLFNREFF